MNRSQVELEEGAHREANLFELHAAPSDKKRQTILDTHHQHDPDQGEIKGKHTTQLRSLHPIACKLSSHYSEMGSKKVLAVFQLAWMLSSTVLIWRAGDHLSLRMSRQMRPSLSMFGW